jgi:lipocalin-like protein
MVMVSDSLLGTWDFVSFSARLPDGSATEPWGAHPVGRIAYDPDGNVTALVMHELRNEADGRSSPPDTQAEFSAYFGRYKVDEARGLVTHTISGSLSAAHASHELQRNYELRDGVLTLSFTRPRNGLPVAHVLSFKRISSQRR